MSDFERVQADGPIARPRRARPAGGSGGVSPSAPAGPLTTSSVLHLQRTAGNQTVAQLLAGGPAAGAPTEDILPTGGGSPLDTGLQRSMESAFGTSFGDVRVHTGSQASKAAESVGASAYTVGSDIVFREGQFNPSSSDGQRTLAHELTHVVQQRSGPVDGTPTGAGFSVSDPGDRFEQAASATAAAVVDGGAAEAAAGGAQAGPTAQRELPEDEELPS